MKKLLVLLFLAVMIFSANVRANAVTLNPTDDVYLSQSYTYNLDYISANSRTRTVLKFDLSSIPSTQKITSATLTMYLSTLGFIQTNPKDSLYYFTDNNWTDDGKNGVSILSYANSFAYDTTSPLAEGVLVGNAKTWTFDLSNIDLQDELSLILQSYNYGGDATKAEVFQSRTTGQYAPVLTLTTVPAPEPSSMLLGLLSISGLLGLKRKK
jgi:hypothetical protein